MIRSGSNRSVADVASELRAKYPDTPFLALGQSVFWDEPMKAVLRQVLDRNGLGGKIVVGVHDTDYFAKSPVGLPGPGRFVAMAHNDGTTKSLWSAAGEVSTLFGSETFPSRHEFVRSGVPIHRLAASSTQGVQAFIDTVTEAWGWRGLVYTGSSDRIVHALKLSEVGDGMIDILSWGFEEAVRQIVPGCCQNEARNTADTLLGYCREYSANHPDQTLSDLFQFVLPRIYSLLLGYSPDNLEVTCTAHLLRLTPETAHLPRFHFVDLFLRPETHQIAVDAYNRVVAGSEIYTLDRFGAGALPFDCFIPGRGRGTLRITKRVLFVETRNPVTIPLESPIENIHQLAAALTSHHGNHVTLVGKAVSLVSMLAREFIFVFNEEGSMYVSRTREMNDILAAAGADIAMHPILRLKYHTWDSLTVARSTLRPTAHLASTFGRSTLLAAEFGAQWQNVVEEQRALIDQLSRLRKPLELMGFLQERDAAGHWEELTERYVAARAQLAALRSQALSVQQALQSDYGRLRLLKSRSQAAQRDSGIHFRSVSEWTPPELARRAAYKGEIEAVRKHQKLLCKDIERMRQQREELERGEKALAARAVLRDIERQAEMARLELVRNACLTIDGLTHTNHRPSAWWMPVVDTSGAWFQKIAETAVAYTQPLAT